MSVDASAMLEKNKSEVGERRAEMEWGVGDEIFSKGSVRRSSNSPAWLGPGGSTYQLQIGAALEKPWQQHYASAAVRTDPESKSPPHVNIISIWRLRHI